MRFKLILIKNYKSIKELQIPLQSYGGNNAKNKATFFVGMNESGKSAILEAINSLSTGLDKIDYNDVCFLPIQDSNEYVDIYGEIDLESIVAIEKEISERCDFPAPLLSSIKIKSIKKNVFLNNKISGEAYNIEIESLNYFEYIVKKLNVGLPSRVTASEVIKILKDENAIDDDVTEDNAKSFLNSDQTLLTKDKLETLIAEKMKAHLDSLLPTIQIWKPSPEFLINSKISLNDFKENTKLSIPLKNMFHIYGKKNDSEIKAAIDRGLSNQARMDELKDKMSSLVTKHINRVWKEHQIKIKISINTDDCEVHVEDKDKNYSYYRMDQRSDGFKQFISLILSLSAENENNTLNDNIILIDEPEVHLHPSGVRYMRDEILKIGKKNFVFVATHSHYLVDTSCPERHWIVTKQKGETKIKQIDESTPIEDDSVLSSAFGLSLFKELLPKNIIVVEGADDKSIIAHSIRILNSHFFYSIKTAKGASKAYGIAALLNEENIPAYFIFDDDKEGIDYKNKVIENFKESFSEKNVFTLRDINPDLPKSCTVEDLLPINYVKSFLEKELNQTLDLTDNFPVISQLKNQSQTVRENKAKLDSIKIKLANTFIKEYDSKDKIEKSAPRLSLLTKKFVSQIVV